MKNTILDGNRLKAVPKIRNKARMSTFGTFIQLSTEVLARVIRQEKTNKIFKLERKKTSFHR